MTIRVPSAAAEATDADIDAVVHVLRSGLWANGPEAARLEEDFCEVLGVPHSVAVASGTDALYVAARALGIEHKVVLVAAYSFAATSNAFVALGNRVIPVDVDPVTMNMSPAALSVALEHHPEASAVVFVDLYGSSSGTDECMEVARNSGMLVIEDACQAHGTTAADGRPVGTRADATAFSLYATKNVAAGEGGIVTTGEAEVADRVRSLRNHGISSDGGFALPGLNHRIPEMSAALARSRLGSLREGNLVRRRHAGALAPICEAAWPGVAVPTVPTAMIHVFHQFTVQLPDPAVRDQVQAALQRRGVDARVFYPYTLAELPGVEHLDVPAARSLTGRCLSLPVHPGLSAAQLDALYEAIAAVGGELFA